MQVDAANRVESAKSNPVAKDQGSHDWAQEASQKLKVIRRDGSTMPFKASKISVALTSAFLDEEGRTAALSTRVHEIVAEISQEVCRQLLRFLSYGGAVGVEDIQDQVELGLMRYDRPSVPREHMHQVLRSYIFYREKHRLQRAEREKKQQAEQDKQLHVALEDGRKVPLDLDFIKRTVEEACSGLEEVTPEPIIKDTLRNIFNGIKLVDVHKALIMSARSLIEKEPNYSFVASRLLLNDVRIESMTFLNLPVAYNQDDMQRYYGSALLAAINHGIEVNRLDPRLGEFDLERLGQALDAKRDFQFTYLGLQTLYDRYFLHTDGKRFELPQVFFMRVAMGLALMEDDKNARAIEFYQLLSSFDFMSSTPTLFNSGCVRSQLSSCFLTTIPDDLSEIYNAIKDNALLSKFAGGLGNDWTPVRAMNAHIKGTNGKSQGVVPFLKVANDTAVAVNQGGKRKGAVCAYLETWHLDIEEFVELRKNTGDERRRTHDMNTANWVPDLFMQRVHNDEEWTLFSPDDAPDLHDLYGKAFKEAYEAYEAKADKGELKHFKRVRAVNLWRKMLGMLFETGHPWITFKDPCNIRSPQQHIGVIHSSNLCTEITLNTSVDEIAVCNLGSINLAQHVEASGLNTEKLKKTVKTAIRMLDNVIDINYYSVEQARRSNLKHRPIGLGLMGFQDALYKLGFAYESEQAVEFADISMEHISYHAIQASMELAKERGSYETYEGSLWSQGILPIDSIQLLKDARDGHIDQNVEKRLDWDSLRQKIQSNGMRNSNVLAIAPTATISNICGVAQSIEPTYQNLFVKSNLSGEFTVVNPFLVADLKAEGLWDEVMVNDLKYFDGSVKSIDRIPPKLASKYATAFEIDPKWLIDAASRRQKWIDQAQSLNLYMGKPSGKKLDNLYRLAWNKGLKTTYYLRSLGATDAEKSTLQTGALNAVKVDQQQAPKACSIDDPDCEACQ